MTIVRVRAVAYTEVVIEVDALYGDAAGVARRLRSEGLNARQIKGEVIVMPPTDEPSSTQGALQL